MGRSSPAYEPAGTALAGRGGVGSAKPRDIQSRTRLPSSNVWWQALLSLFVVRRWLNISQCFPVFGYLLSTPSHLSRKRWAKRYVILGEVSSSDHYRGFLYQSFE